MLNNPNWKQPEVKTEPEVDEISQCFSRAADYLEQHGWCQYSYKNEMGQVCALGAIGHAMGTLTAPTEMQCVARFYKVHNIDMVELNDTCGQTRDKIVHALRQAAMWREPCQG